MFTRSHFSLKLPTYVETILTKQLHDLIVTKLCQTPGDRLYMETRLKQTDAAERRRSTIQKDSKPSEFSRPLTSISLKLNRDLNVTASSRPPRQFA